jgi:hypothetical protein
MNGYIVHAPFPYTGRSGGIRALYKLADELQQREYPVAVASLGASPWQADECPYEVEPAHTWSASKRDEAIHVYPEYLHVADPAPKSVLWMLGPKRYEWNGLEFGWLDSFGAPRLVVDIIEREFFYPKTEPGEGVLFWVGKGRSGPVPVGAREITYDWPANRKELGDILRAAALLISFDSFTALTLEAALCGTPVGLPNGPLAESVLTADGYRDEIAHDVDRFIEITSAHFGG